MDRHEEKDVSAWTTPLLKKRLRGRVLMRGARSSPHMGEESLFPRHGQGILPCAEIDAKISSLLLTEKGPSQRQESPPQKGANSPHGKLEKVLKKLTLPRARDQRGTQDN